MPNEQQETDTFIVNPHSLCKVKVPPPIQLSNLDWVNIENESDKFLLVLTILLDRHKIKKEFDFHLSDIQTILLGSCGPGARDLKGIVQQYLGNSHKALYAPDGGRAQRVKVACYNTNGDIVKYFASYESRADPMDISFINKEVVPKKKAVHPAPHQFFKIDAE